MASKIASLGQFYESLSGIVFKKPTYSMAKNKSPSHFPTFRRIAIACATLSILRYPTSFSHLELRPPQAMLMRYANTERT